MASLDVRTAFDVARWSVVSRVLTYMGAHEHVVAALLEEMKDVRGSACFENSETEFRDSRCVRQGSVDGEDGWSVGELKGSGRPRFGGSCLVETEMMIIDSAV